LTKDFGYAANYEVGKCLSLFGYPVQCKFLKFNIVLVML